MSLSNDKDLISQLLRIAQGVSSTPATQPAAPVALTPEARTLAQKLISKLQQEVISKAPQGPIWPLFSDKIDVEQIRKFIDQYITFMSPRNPSSASAFGNIKSALNTFLTTYPGMTAQALGTEGISQIQRNIFNLSGKKESSVEKYIEYLQSFIGSVNTALTELERIYKQNNRQDYLSEIQEQKSYYQQNLNQLERLQQAAKDDFNNQKVQNGR